MPSTPISTNVWAREHLARVEETLRRRIVNPPVASNPVTYTTVSSTTGANTSELPPSEIPEVQEVPVEVWTEVINSARRPWAQPRDPQGRFASHNGPQELKAHVPTSTKTGICGWFQKLDQTHT